VDFAPSMASQAPVMSSISKLLCADWVMNGPLHGQWSTGLGVLGMVLKPDLWHDVTGTPVIGCQLQCYSVYYYAQFHTIANAFAHLQYTPNVLQLMSALLYLCIMRILAFTGLTLLFFDSRAFRGGQHQSAEQNFSIIISRWHWFSENTQYVGAHAEFPCHFDELPGVPRHYSFDWMLRSRKALIIRMVTTLTVLGMLLLLVQWNALVWHKIALTILHID